jgi:predicted LPLAT superfamily acyltransferase
MSSAPRKAAGFAAAGAPAEWIQHHERGSTALLKLMSHMSRRLGRRASRVFLYGIALYFFGFAPSARRGARRYLGLALGRPPRARDRFRQILYFATTIHDRVFLLDGRLDRFEVTVAGAEAMQQAVRADGRGALLMGAHLGSFEILHCLGRERGGLPLAMAMYEANARKINSTLAAINPAAVPDIVPLGQIDAMLKIAQRLDQGTSVGVLADRTLGNEPVQQVRLLGERASLPTGPMRAAAILRCRVYFMAGLYRGGNRYHVVFEPIADFRTMAAGARSAEVSAAVDRYAAALERHCRSDPYDWFNFHDLWAARAAPSESRR